MNIRAVSILLPATALALAAFACRLPTEEAVPVVSYTVDVVWHTGGTPREAIFSDGTVTAIAIDAVNAAGAGIGSGALTRRETEWRGGVTVSELGLVTFRGHARDASGNELYFGEQDANLDGTDDQVVIDMSRLYRTWTSVTPAGATTTANWDAIAVSADGQTIVLGSQYYVYVSTNGGSTWTKRSVPGSSAYYALAMSDDGSRLYLPRRSEGIYISTNLGATWSAPYDGEAGDTGDWYSIACSSDGQKVVGVRNGGCVSVSGNGGTNWTSIAATSDAVPTAMNALWWVDVDCSASGQYMAAAASSAKMHVSDDSGATWKTYYFAREWASVSVSGSGAEMAATVGTTTSNYVHTSPDYGVTWSTNTNSSGARAWSDVAYAPDGSLIVAGLYGGSLYASVDDGLTWSALAAGSVYWTDIVFKPATDLVYACARGDYLYSSADKGATWTAYRAMTGARDWDSIAASADGQYAVAALDGGLLFTTADYGATWTERPGAGSRYWSGVAVSSTGEKMSAVWNDGGTGGGIVTSADYGVTWTAQSVTSRVYQGVAMSDDGTKQIAGIGMNGGYLYLSTTSGASWSAWSGSNTLWWAAVTISADGLRAAAAVDNGSIWTGYKPVSTWTWTERTAAGSRYWKSMDMSADGSVVVALESSALYVSLDYGTTWTTRTPAGATSLQSVACSADGLRMAVATYYGDVYTSTDAGVTWTTRDYGQAPQYLAMSADGARIYGVSGSTMPVYIGY